MIAIVEAVPYIAFAGAALLLAWVGIDLLRAKLRAATRNAPAPAESGRGLAGKPEPLGSMAPANAPEPVFEVQYDSPLVAEAVVQLSGESGPVIGLQMEGDSRPLNALNPATDPGLTFNRDTEVPVITPEITTESDKMAAVGSAASSPVLSSPLVRRDPSVRVFDTAVAASDRVSPAQSG